MADNTNSSFSFLNPEYPSLMSGGLKYKYVSPEHLSLDLDLGKYLAWLEAEAAKEYAAQEAEARKAEEENKKFKEGYLSAMNSFRFAGGVPGQDYMQLAALSGITNSLGPRKAAKVAGYSALGQLAGGALGAGLALSGPVILRGFNALWNPFSTGRAAVTNLALRSFRFTPKVANGILNTTLHPAVLLGTKAADTALIHIPAYVESAKHTYDKLTGKQNWFTNKEGNFDLGTSVETALDPLFILQAGKKAYKVGKFLKDAWPKVTITSAYPGYEEKLTNYLLTVGEPLLLNK